MLRSNSGSQIFVATLIGIASGLVVSNLLPFELIENEVLRGSWVLWGVFTCVLVACSVQAWISPDTKEVDGASFDATAAPEQTVDAAQSSQEDVIAAKEVQKYSRPKWIPTRDETGEIRPDLAATAVQSKASDKTNKDIAFQRISVTKPDGTELDLTAMVLFDTKSWKQGQHHLLVGESPQGISPIKAIRNQDIADEVNNAIALYCVGLASTEFEVTQADDNTVLSDNRAIRLCNALHELEYVNDGSGLQRTVAVGLGERIPDQADNTPAPRQRAAVIIAAKQLDSTHTERDVIDAFRAGLDIVSVSLDKYQRSDDSIFKMFDVTDSEFCHSVTGNWIMTDGLADRLVVCAPDGPGP